MLALILDREFCHGADGADLGYRTSQAMVRRREAEDFGGGGTVRSSHLRCGAPPRHLPRTNPALAQNVHDI